MAYAIFKTGGKQYRVQAGDVIDVECINTLEEGAEASFDQVLMVENDGNVTTRHPDGGRSYGSPPRSSASSATSRSSTFKFKRRKGFHKKKGSRRAMTRLEITGINA